MKAHFSFRTIVLPISILIFFFMAVGELAAFSLESNSVLVNRREIVETTPTFTGTVTCFTARGDEDYSVGYYIDGGALVSDYSLLADDDSEISSLRVHLVAFDNLSDLTDDSDDYIFNPVIATGEGTDLTLTGTICVLDNGDGSIASDFSGRGASVIAANDAKVTVDGMRIYTEGFVRAAFIADTYGQVLVKNANVTVMGADPLTEAYEDYVNSANQSIMISPPWVLGIQGGARLANVLGDYATLTLIDTKAAAGGWGVLSTDACTSPIVNVVDSKLEILPESKGGMSSGNFPYSRKYGSGYGTYIIGNALEYFYGTTFKGTTYASILTGGDAYYMSSRGEVVLADAEGAEIETVRGRGDNTAIHSVFGFMAHNSGSINVLDGTVVDTEEATFLYKAGDVDFVADSAVLKPASGIILQMIDNDDSTVGGEMSGFNTEFFEDEGWPSETDNVTGETDETEEETAEVAETADDTDDAEDTEDTDDTDDGDSDDGEETPGEGPGGPGGGGGGPGGGGGGSNTATLTLSNGHYKGDVFNGTGYYTQSGDALEVSIGEGATLEGAVSLTETIHVDEYGEQNTYFTIYEYYYLGHVANRNYRNPDSTIGVTLSDGGVWKVGGESWISSLLVEDGAVTAPGGYEVVMTVDDVETEIETGVEYSGDIVLSLVELPPNDPGHHNRHQNNQCENNQKR